MRTAIYARYSSELQRDASIEDQVRLCKARIHAEKWVAVGIYTDHAMSGSIRMRPGYQKLLEDARAGTFDVVVAEALDRLSRDQEDIAALFKHLSFAGVTMVTLAEGEISELHVGLKGTMNALFLKDLAKKVRRGLEGRVRDGKSGGGLGYGYQAIRKLDERGELIRGDRRIDQFQAEIVRRIFREYVAGQSPRAIVRDLNAEGIRGPRSAFWTASTVHGNWQRGTGILNNELYIGRLVWNRQRFVIDPASGRRLGRPNPEKDWVIQEVPELRLVDDDLWAAAKARQRSHSDRVRHVKQGNHLNAAHRPRYLLSGLISCGSCGSAYSMIGNDRYGCSGHRNRGTCENRLAIRRDELEERALRGLKDKLLAPELMEEFIRAFHEELDSKSRVAVSTYDTSRRELAETSRKIESILGAIEAGIYTPTTRDRLVELERRKAELETIRPVPPSPRLHPKLSEVYREKVGRLVDALNEPNTRAEASQALRALIEVIRLTPTAENTGLSAELHGELAGIISLSRGIQPSRTGLDRPARLSLVAGARYQRYYPLFVARVPRTKP